MSHDFNAIGRPHRRVDGIGKVTGQARFGADLGAPGMLWGRVLLARRPHARILSVETSRARDLPGVRAVLTAEDLPHAKLFGVIIKNQPVLAFDRVRYYGDGVAMVAADSEEIAERALELIDVRYEDLPGVFDPEEAMLPEAPLVHPVDGTNTFVHHHVREGEIEKGFAASAVVLERTYRTQHVEHAYLEPEAVLAERTEDGGFRVTGSIQNIFSTRKSLAEVLGCDLARITVKHAVMGGSFGGKDEVMTQMACRAALLARATGRPVKMVNSRESSMTESYKRHPYVLHYRIGADAAGRLQALEVRIVADGGAYASQSPFVTWRSVVQAGGPYQCPNVSVDVFAAYTNNCYTGAMRGFGSPQVNFTIESLMDELAAALDLDPLEIRLRNVYEHGSVTPTGQKLDHEVSIREVLLRATEAAHWQERRREFEASNASREDGRRLGLGLACSYRGVSLGAEGTDAVGAIVSVQSDGSVLVSCGLTDMGQGVSSALSLIAAEVLGIGVERVKFFAVHTGRVPDSGPTVASRSTIMGGQAAKKAAEAVREVLFEIAADELGVSAERLTARAGRIEVRGPEQESPVCKPERTHAWSPEEGEAHGPAPGISFEQTVALAYSRGRPLLGFGWHKSPHTSWDEKTGAGEAYFTFVYGANVAEVEVDTETGAVEVLRVTAVHDVGRAISPAMIRSQICGGIAMGTGYGILERYAIEKGVPQARNLDEYLLVGAADMPEVEAILVENPDAAGPFGAKSIGEPATEIAAPAILNAVAHATGRRVRQIPADLETVLLGAPLRPNGKPAASTRAAERDASGREIP